MNYKEIGYSIRILWGLITQTSSTKGGSLSRLNTESNQGMDLTVAVAQQIKRFCAAGKVPV